VTLVILVADGARPDTLFGAMDAGHLPALSALRDSGIATTLSSVFPSVTGSAYAPFLTGLHPGRVGLPGLRWYDRDRSATLWPAHARSYVGLGGMRADKDLSRDYRTLFELEPRSLGGFTYIGRGLSTRRRIGTGWGFGAKLAWTHFRGDLDGWMRFDRWLGEEFVRRIVAQNPRVAFLAHPGIDKLSHQFGQGSPRILSAMQTVDHTVTLLRDAFAQQGRSEELEIWIVSDHGHAAVSQHEDLAGRIASWGHSVRAHPWVLGGRDVAVMVSGNAMAHLYLELGRKRRPVGSARHFPGARFGFRDGIRNRRRHDHRATRVDRPPARRELRPGHHRRIIGSARAFVAVTGRRKRCRQQHPNLFDMKVLHGLPPQETEGMTAVANAPQPVPSLAVTRTNWPACHGGGGERSRR
jgi:hypothetical protein